MINKIIAFLPKLFIILGIFFIIFGCRALYEHLTFESAKGVIQDVKESEVINLEDKDTYNYEITINYTVDGKDYTAILYSYDDNYTVGQEIDIFYDPDEPNTIAIELQKGLLLLFGAGVLCLIYALIYWLRSSIILQK